MRALLFVVYAIFAALLPVFVVWTTHGAHTPFWFLSGDSFLYMGIAESSRGLTMSYDGIEPTNGFHPLWQIIVRVMVALSSSQLMTMNLVSWGAILAALVGVLLLGFAIKRFTGSWLLAMLVVPGAYYMLLGQALRNMPIWSFYDGMEVGLASLIIAGIILLASYSETMENRSRFWLAIGLLLALQVLTRLDEVFVTFAVTLAVFFWPGSPLRERFKFAFLVAAPGFVAMVGYITWSYLSTGLPMPVSGMAKGEGAFLSNAWVTMATLFAPIIDLRETLSSGYVPDRAALLSAAFRVTELIVPGLFALVLLVHIARKYSSKPWAPLLIGLCAGVMIKTAYNLVAVNYWHQATWYFAVSSTLMTFGLALMLKPVSESLRRTRPLMRVGATALMAVVTIFHASIWASESMVSPYPQSQLTFWQSGTELEEHLLEIDPDMRVLEFGDGMLNFTLDMPVRHGFVFAGDHGSLEALQSSRLLRNSYADGFTVISSYFYLVVPEGAEEWNSDEIRAFLQASFLEDRVQSELDLFDFEMLHVARPQGAPFIRLIPRDAPGDAPESAMQADG